MYQKNKTKLKPDLHKAQLLSDNITPSIATLNETKQIITDVDKLSHSATICNKVL